MTDASMVPSSQGVRETPTPRTDSLMGSIIEDGAVPLEKAWMIEEFARQLERELAAKEREANDAHEKAHHYYCELQQARGEALAGVREFLFAQYHTSKKAADVLDELEKYLKPSPASGEQINAAGQELPAVTSASRQNHDETVIGSSTTETNSASRRSVIAETVRDSAQYPAPAAPNAVPDDPVAVFDTILGPAFTSNPNSHFSQAIRALAEHYEAKGMRRAAEICTGLGMLGHWHFSAAILEADAKEADR